MPPAYAADPSTWPVFGGEVDGWSPVAFLRGMWADMRLRGMAERRKDGGGKKIGISLAETRGR